MKYITKVVERGGSKLKNILSNIDPWKGLHCGREACRPCSQPGQKKDNDRKGILFKNQDEKKITKDMEDRRPTPNK